MSVKIKNMKKEHCSDTRFIGKRYGEAENFGARWGEWHCNGWFDELEKLGSFSFNDDGYMGLKRIHEGRLEYWIGMFFAADTAVPEGYDYVDIAAMDYAVFWVCGKECSGELTSFATHELCLEELKKQGWVRREDDWCFERYQCPRYTTPDAEGNVIVDYGISIEDTI